MCKNGWSGPELNHLDREQYGKLEDSVDIKPGGTWGSKHQSPPHLSVLSHLLSASSFHTTSLAQKKKKKDVLCNLLYFLTTLIYILVFNCSIKCKV